MQRGLLADDSRLPDRICGTLVAFHHIQPLDGNSGLLREDSLDFTSLSLVFTGDYLNGVILVNV